MGNKNIKNMNMEIEKYKFIKNVNDERVKNGQIYEYLETE